MDEICTKIGNSDEVIDKIGYFELTKEEVLEKIFTVNMLVAQYKIRATIKRTNKSTVIQGNAAFENQYICLSVCN